MKVIYISILCKCDRADYDAREAQEEHSCSNEQYHWRVGLYKVKASAEKVNTVRIRNPLIGVSRNALMQDVESFAAEHSLQDILPLLRKGAIAAQNPLIADSMPDFDEHEKAALRDEVTHRWRQPKILYFTIILNSIAAAIQGWDQTGSNGANLSFPQAFGIDEGPEGPCAVTGTCERNQWLVGAINSMPYFAIFLL